MKFEHYTCAGCRHKHSKLGDGHRVIQPCYLRAPRSPDTQQDEWGAESELRNRSLLRGQVRGRMFASWVSLGPDASSDFTLGNRFQRALSRRLRGFRGSWVQSPKGPHASSADCTLRDVWILDTHVAPSPGFRHPELRAWACTRSVARRHWCPKRPLLLHRPSLRWHLASGRSLF